MTKTVVFAVIGEPQGKGRPRFTSTGRVYTPKQTTEYETKIKAGYNKEKTECIPKGSQVSVAIKAYFAIPKSASKKKAIEMLNGKIRPTKKPDADNIIKIVCDALNGVAYHDDAQVVDIQCRKFYGAVPHIKIKIEEIGDSENG